MTLSSLVSLASPNLSCSVHLSRWKKIRKVRRNASGSVALATLGLILTTVPTILNEGSVSESYAWIPMLNSDFTLSVDGISISMAIVTMVLMLAAAIYSINYMAGKKNLPLYYALLSLLFVGLVGVFITSNLLFFYFCWELMLVPAYFIIGGWGYKDSPTKQASNSSFSLTQAQSSSS